MKTILLLGFLFLNNVTCTESKTVYICVSKNAKRYHYDSKCRGINNCNYRIMKTTLVIAQGKGLTLCGFEKEQP